MLTSHALIITKLLVIVIVVVVIVIAIFEYFDRFLREVHYNVHEHDFDKNNDADWACISLYVSLHFRLAIFVRHDAHVDTGVRQGVTVVIARLETRATRASISGRTGEKRVLYKEI
jgi:hypothetical protein